MEKIGAARCAVMLQCQHHVSSRHLRADLGSHAWQLYKSSLALQLQQQVPDERDG